MLSCSEDNKMYKMSTVFFKHKVAVFKHITSLFDVLIVVTFVGF